MFRRMMSHLEVGSEGQPKWKRKKKKKCDRGFNFLGELIEVQRHREPKINKDWFDRVEENDREEKQKKLNWSREKKSEIHIIS